VKRRRPKVYAIGEPTILQPTPAWLTQRRREAFQAGAEAEAKRRAPKRKLDAALALGLQDKLEAHLKTLGAKPKKQSTLVPWVEEQMRVKGREPPQDGGLMITRLIVRPVYQRLGWAKTRK